MCPRRKYPESTRPSLQVTGWAKKVSRVHAAFSASYGLGASNAPALSAQIRLRSMKTLNTATSSDDHHDSTETDRGVPFHGSCSRCHHCPSNHRPEIFCDRCNHTMLGSEKVSSQSAFPSVKSDSTFNQDKEEESCATADTLVQSIIQVNQKSEDAMKACSSDKPPPSDSIVRFIPGIHQRFEDVLDTSISVQEVFSDVGDLVPKIRIQQVAFDNACKLLLVTAAKSRQDVDNMIEDPGHPIWKDRVVHRSLDNVIARFHQLCLEVLEHVQGRLSELNHRLQTLRGQGKKKHTRYKFWLIRSSSLPFGTTEELPELVRNLKYYNDIFCALIWQTVPRGSNNLLGSSSSASAEDLSYRTAIRAARASNRHCICIQRASQVLHDTLSEAWTCHDHDAHSLSISLNFDHAKAGAVARPEVIRFDVVVTSPRFEGAYRLVVDSTRGDFCTCQRLGESRSLKKTYLVDRVTGPAAGKGVVVPAAQAKSPDSSDVGVVTAAYRTERQRGRFLVSSESTQNTVPDLGLEEDLCRCLRKSSASMEESKARAGCSCLGYLETRNGLMFFFYYVFSGEYQRQGSHSLDDVLVYASDEGRTVPLKDRLRLASFLAVGVLNLNTSSWLPQAWSSRDIYLFDTLGEPFLQTRLDVNTPREPVCEVEDFDTTRPSLLSLGLVLIELAFSAPWRKLQLREEITKNLVESERNFLNLMHLSETTSRELGSRYAKVVQTCLLHGLGAQGTHGLGKKEFDEVILEDIVRELDQCLSAVTMP